MRTRWGRAASLLLLTAASCAAPPPQTARVQRSPLPEAYAQAFRSDQIGTPEEAIRSHIDLVRLAAQASGDPWQDAALAAALDGLVGRALPALGDGARDAPLAYRTGAEAAIAAELDHDLGNARGPFARGLVARALLELSERRGQIERAAALRTATGCAMEAVVVGPTLGEPVTGVLATEPLDMPGATLSPSVGVEGPFGLRTAPVKVAGHGCSLSLFAASPQPGVREVVLDVTVGRPQTIGVVLRAHGAALLRAAGTPIVSRSFDLGDGDAARFVRVAVTAGVTRLVLRVGTAREDDSVEIDTFDESGMPLAARAPAIGASANGRVLSVSEELATGRIETDDDRVLAAAAALGNGDPRTADRLLWAEATHEGARPDVSILYGRAIGSARDLSPAVRSERARSTYERARDAWPQSWEAVIAHAVLAGARRGRDESAIETLRDLDAWRDKQRGDAPRQVGVIAAFDAMVSGHEKLFDRAATALSRAESLRGSPLFTTASDAIEPRVGVERARVLCERPSERDSLACYEALHAAGDRPRAAQELARLRALLGAPAAFLPIELRDALAANDAPEAAVAFDAMLPGERTLSELALVAGSDAHPQLLALARTASDAPSALGPLLSSEGDDQARAFDQEAERVVDEDRAKPFLPDAATAVLAHAERYSVASDGLLRWTLFDVRRVNGTTDVEENAEASAPDVTGRGVLRAIRRRILKRDGRIIEPDRTPHASQAHADLSQLEQGDAIEAVYAGYALPTETGDLGIDTPDLLPERTGVHEASIELSFPRTLQASHWSHPLLGRAVERVDGEMRTLTYKLESRPARRLEDGVPKMDRSVAVSFTTATWAGVADGLRENVASLDEQDPEIGAWAKSAVDGAGPSPRERVEALVVAAGKAVHESSAEILSERAGGPDAVQTETARTFLTAREGSRDWLVLRGLRELGIRAELVVAESDPFSSDPAFPPHSGRFVHPLVVAHLGSSEAGDVWVDADVQGPPLPAGRISPELRGRLALREDGRIEVLPSVGAKEDERDEVDLRLALDSEGSARGTFAVVLRGRDAQELAEALFRLVGAERKRALRDVVLAWLPWANVDDVELASSEGSWQISLRAGVSVSGYAQAQGKKAWLLPGLDPLHWAWPRARVSTLAATYATRAGRESALSVSSAFQYHVHRRVELPRGASVARAPGPLEVRSKLIDAGRRITVTGDAIEDDFTLAVTTGTVSAELYRPFVVSAHAADDGFLASTWVSVP